MRHFITFQKRKGLFIEKGIESNDSLALQINHELMSYGYVLSQKLYDRLSTQSEAYLEVVYNDLVKGITNITGGAGHEPIYRNFPQSVVKLSYHEFAINAIFHYWSAGHWRPEDAEYINREFKIEAINYKEISLLEESQFNAIFSDILYSNNSISKFDKQVVDWFIDNNYSFEFGKIGFKETVAYVGKRLVESDILYLPTRDATSVLRIWSAYSGGDEGLKENTVFKLPTSKQRRLLLTTLNGSNNLEESFKIYREKWLKLLFYLNPLVAKYRKKYPVLAEYVIKLRNEPKELRTFNSKIEGFLAKKDILVLELLKTRMGTFTRRLDHTVRLFGVTAIESWLDNNPTGPQMITAYNHFTNRDKDLAGRSVVLASQSQSEVVTYDSLEPLNAKLVARIKELLLERLHGLTNVTLGDSKVYIDKALYYRPLGINNRASSFSLDGKGIGTVESVPAGKTIRMYVHWEDRSDIDLSGFIITSNNEVMKIGWNGGHHFNGAVIYSGDNTGYSNKNAEYLDINTSSLPKDVIWVINEARIFRGPRDFKSYNGKARAGWMLRDKPEVNSHWLPETLDHSVVLTSDSTTAYLMAFHLPTRSIVYLDVSMGTSMVSTSEDALKMRLYLENFVMAESEDINWDKINQGHLINLLSKVIVDKPEDADIVFNEHTTVEEVTKYLV